MPESSVFATFCPWAEKKLMVFCFAAGGWGRGLAAPLPVHVLRREVPSSEQAHPAHPVAQSGDAQIQGATPSAHPPPAGFRTTRTLWPEGSTWVLWASRRPVWTAWLPRRFSSWWPLRTQRRPLQVLRQVVPWCGLPDCSLARPHGWPALQMWVLRQGLQAAAPHEGSLSRSHRRATFPVQPLRENVLAVDDPEGAREDPLSQVCTQDAGAQQRGRAPRGGRTSTSAIMLTADSRWVSFEPIRITHRPFPRAMVVRRGIVIGLLFLLWAALYESLKRYVINEGLMKFNDYIDDND